MLLLQGQEHALSVLVVLEQTLTVEFSIRTRVSIATWRKKICRDITNSCYVGNHLNDFINRRKLGKEIRSGIALQDIRGEGISCLVRSFQAVCIGFV